MDLGPEITEKQIFEVIYVIHKLPPIRINCDSENYSQLISTKWILCLKRPISTIISGMDLGENKTKQNKTNKQKNLLH